MANNSIVLIVENDPSLRRILEIKFRNKGYQVHTARDGAEGYDLILKENLRIPVMANSDSGGSRTAVRMMANKSRSEATLFF